MRFIEGEKVLYVVNTATRFPVAKFSDKPIATFGQSEERIWDASPTCSLVYSGYPDKLWADHGFKYTFDRRRQPANLNGLQLWLFVVEAYSFQEMGKRLQDPYKKFTVKSDTPIL